MYLLKDATFAASRTSCASWVLITLSGEHMKRARHILTIWENSGIRLFE
jgi:hypothetical protein